MIFDKKQNYYAFFCLNIFFLLFGGVPALFAEYSGNGIEGVSSPEEPLPENLSPESKKLENLRIKAEVDPNQINELNYLKAFPREFKAFYFTFYGYYPDLEGHEEGDPGFFCEEKQYDTPCPNIFLFAGDSKGKCCSELYYRTEHHIALLERLSKKYPLTVLNIWLDIATGGGWDADGVNFLQDQLTIYAADYTEIFARELNKRSPADRLSIVKFIGNGHVFGIRSYEEYLRITGNLRELGFLKLHELFKQVRQWRMELPRY